MDDMETSNRGAVAARAIALLLLVAGAILTFRGLTLGLHFQATPQALEDAEKGQAVGYPAALGALLALVVVARPGRSWSRWVLALAGLAVVAALVLELTR